MKEKVNYIQRVNKINEGKSNSALRFVVSWQVEVIKLAAKVFINKFQKLLLRKFDWNVPNHQCCLLKNFIIVIFFSIQNSIQLNLVILWPDKFLLLLDF